MFRLKQPFLGKNISYQNLLAKLWPIIFLCIIFIEIFKDEPSRNYVWRLGKVNMYYKRNCTLRWATTLCRSKITQMFMSWVVVYLPFTVTPFYLCQQLLHSCNADRISFPMIWELSIWTFWCRVLVWWRDGIWQKYTILSYITHKICEKLVVKLDFKNYLRKIRSFDNVFD